MQCVILAGGLGTRLGAISETVPKSLIEIQGSPFLSYQLELLCKNDVDEVILCVGYLSNKIKSYFGNGSKFNIKIQYSIETRSLLGTAGALKNAENLLADNFFLLYGDSYLQVDFKTIYNFYKTSHAKALMTVFRNNSKWDKSNVIFEKGKILCYNKSFNDTKMQFIDYGLSIFNKSVLENIPTDFYYPLDKIQSELAKNGLLCGYEVFTRFYEVGSQKGIEDFTTFVKNSKLC